MHENHQTGIWRKKTCSKGLLVKKAVLYASGRRPFALVALQVASSWCASSQQSNRNVGSFCQGSCEVNVCLRVLLNPQTCTLFLFQKHGMPPFVATCSSCGTQPDFKPQCSVIWSVPEPSASMISKRFARSGGRSRSSIRPWRVKFCPSRVPHLEQRVASAP